MEQFCPAAQNQPRSFMSFPELRSPVFNTNSIMLFCKVRFLLKNLEGSWKVKPLFCGSNTLIQTLKSSIMVITVTPVLQVLQLHRKDSGKGFLNHFI